MAGGARGAGRSSSPATFALDDGTAEASGTAQGATALAVLGLSRPHATAQLAALVMRVGSLSVRRAERQDDVVPVEVRARVDVPSSLSLSLSLSPSLFQARVGVPPYSAVALTPAHTFDQTICVALGRSLTRTDGRWCCHRRTLPWCRAFSGPRAASVFPAQCCVRASHRPPSRSAVRAGRTCRRGRCA